MTRGQAILKDFIGGALTDTQGEYIAKLFDAAIAEAVAQDRTQIAIEISMGNAFAHTLHGIANFIRRGDHIAARRKDWEAARKEGAEEELEVCAMIAEKPYFTHPNIDHGSSPEFVGEKIAWAIRNKSSSRDKSATDERYKCKQCGAANWEAHLFSGVARCKGCGADAKDNAEFMKGTPPMDALEERVNAVFKSVDPEHQGVWLPLRKALAADYRKMLQEILDLPVRFVVDGDRTVPHLSEAKYVDGFESGIREYRKAIAALYPQPVEKKELVWCEDSCPIRWRKYASPFAKGNEFKTSDCPDWENRSGGKLSLRDTHYYFCHGCGKQRPQ